MDKVVLQPRVLLATGSLVPEELDYFAYQAGHYVRLAREYAGRV